MNRWKISLISFALLPMMACASPAADDSAGDGAAYEDGPPLVTADGKGDELAADIPAYGPLPTWGDLDRDFEVMFAPDDPVHTVEMHLIESVTEQRRGDERTFAEGENPYRIRYVVYNLRNPRLVEALADAEDAGVDVQVLIEADQLDPARDYNTSDERLIERGFEFVADHRELEGEAFATADLVGITGSGLMHLKARIFETPAERVVLSGSLNPGDNAMLNEETLHLVRDPDVVARYIGAYERILRGESMENRWDDDAAVNVMFTPAGTNRAVERVFDWLADEEEQILLMMFSLRDLTAPGHDRSLVELLGDKVRDGVPVWVITDRKQSDGVDGSGQRVGWEDGTEDDLRRAGVHVYEATNLATPFTAMHHKVAVLGRTNIRVITDAANWTASGLGSKTRRARNVESQLFIDSAKLDDNRTGRRYLAQWLRVASRYAEQSAADGEPSFPEMFETLTAQQGWPEQEVGFTAHEAHTEFGQSITVRGNLAELGNWSETGHTLVTDGEQYPVWSSEEPIEVPLGFAFEWKFLRGFPDGTPEWETGDNRAGFAQPSVFGTTNLAEHHGVWR